MCFRLYTMVSRCLGGWVLMGTLLKAHLAALTSTIFDIHFTFTYHFLTAKKSKKGHFSTTMSSFPTSAIQTFAAWPLRKCPLTLVMATGNPARKPVEDGSLSQYLTTGFISIPGAWPCDFWIINVFSSETDDLLEKCEVLFLPRFLNVKDLSNLLVSLIWDFRFSSHCKLYIAGAILCHPR